jgi:phage major head subunit gpT-like protein
LGERTYNNFRVYDYVLGNDKFEHTTEVTRDEIEDDQIGVFNDWMTDVGYQSEMWPDDLVTTAFTAGTSTICHDGQYFFDLDHPVDPDRSSTGTQSNILATSPLSATTYAQARARMMGFKEEDGRTLRVTPNLLVVPPTLETMAKRIVNTDLIARVYGSNTAAAAEDNKNVLQGTADVMVWHDLPDTGVEATCDWYLLDTSRPLLPFIFQQRVAPALVPRENPGDPNVWDRDVFQYGVRARGNGGYGLWYLALKGVAT